VAAIFLWLPLSLSPQMPIANTHAELQQLVDTRFHNEVSLWSNIYKKPGVTAEIYRLRRDRALAIIEQLSFSQAFILEIGCGAGLLAVALAQRGYRVEATDRLDAMIRLTSDLAATKDVSDRITVRTCDVHALPYPDRSFDVVVAIGVLPWLHSPEGALREIARVLRDGGQLVVTTDNRWPVTHLFDPLCSPLTEPIRRWARKMLQIRRQKLRPHLYSIRCVDELLARAGFQKIYGTTIGFGPFVFLKCELLPEAIATYAHAKLQWLADRRVWFIRSAGIEYIALAKKRSCVSQEFNARPDSP
jgi:ubiquinone/menaquinone biosynthesis C-methylase UbiE